MIFTNERTLQWSGPSSFTRHSWIKLSLIVQDSSLQPSLTKVGLYFNSNVTVGSPKPVKGRRLGKLFSHPEPDPAKALSSAIQSFPLSNTL